MYKILSVRGNSVSSDVQLISRSEQPVFAFVESVCGTYSPSFVSKSLDRRQLELDCRKLYLDMNVPRKDDYELPEDQVILIGKLKLKHLVSIAKMIEVGDFEVSMYHPLVRAFLEAPSKMSPKLPSSCLHLALFGAIESGKIEKLQTDVIGIHFYFPKKSKYMS
ncbi:hypothetical protein HOG98_02390 [bacterium]|jgi:hypothetical protein|nr:hypothetical protein [bacterium]